MFDSICWKVREIIKCEHEVFVSGGNRKQGSERMIKWTFSNSGWVKCNTDGASKEVDSIASCGGVLRDDRFL